MWIIIYWRFKISKLVFFDIIKIIVFNIFIFCIVRNSDNFIKDIIVIVVGIIVFIMDIIFIFIMDIIFVFIMDVIFIINMDILFIINMDIIILISIIFMDILL